MPPKIKTRKVSTKNIKPPRSRRLNSLEAYSDNRLFSPGSIAVIGIVLFFAFVIAQIIFIN